MPKQTADNVSGNVLAPALEAKRSQQIHHDVVVVTSIESNIVTTGINNGPHDIQCLISVERSDFDCVDRVDFGKAPPKLTRQDATTNRRLEVKSEQREDFSHCFAVG